MPMGPKEIKLREQREERAKKVVVVRTGKIKASAKSIGKLSSVKVSKRP